MVRAKLELKIITPKGTDLLKKGITERCILRTGPDLRECCVINDTCMYGVSTTQLPTKCPLKGGPILMKLAINSLQRNNNG